MTLKKGQVAGLATGLLAFALVALVPSGLHEVAGFGHRPALAAGVTLAMSIFWLTECIDISFTALIPLLAFPLLGVFGKGLWGDVVKTGEEFVNAYIFLFLGGMALGAAMEHWNLHRRIALTVMRSIGTSPPRLMFGLLLATAAVSMWISNTATAVMMTPIAVAILSELQLRTGQPLKRYGMLLLLGVAWGSNLGGVGTKIGTATNSIFVNFMSTTLKRDIGFVEYLTIGLPFVGLMLPVVWLVMWWQGRVDAPAGDTSRELIEAQLKALGSMGREEKRVAWAFGLAALFWVLGDPIRSALEPLWGRPIANRHYEAAVAMAAAGLAWLLRAMPLGAVKRIPVTGLLLLGGSFAMAAGIEGSGLASWLGVQLKPLNTLSVPVQYLVVSGVTIFASAFASNTATAAVFLPLLPHSPALLSTVAIGSSCDYALPAGTPPNAIVFGTGKISLPLMMRLGVMLDGVTALVLAGYGGLYLRWLLE